MGNLVLWAIMAGDAPATSRRVLRSAAHQFCLADNVAYVGPLYFLSAFFYSGSIEKGWVEFLSQGDALRFANLMWSFRENAKLPNPLAPARNQRRRRSTRP